MVRIIRDNERDFTKVVDGVKEDYGSITKRYNSMVKKDIKSQKPSDQGVSDDLVLQTGKSQNKIREKFYQNCNK